MHMRMRACGCKWVASAFLPLLLLTSSAAQLQGSANALADSSNAPASASSQVPLPASTPAAGLSAIDVTTAGDAGAIAVAAIDDDAITAGDAGAIAVAATAAAHADGANELEYDREDLDASKKQRHEKRVFLIWAIASTAVLVCLVAATAVLAASNRASRMSASLAAHDIDGSSPSSPDLDAPIANAKPKNALSTRAKKQASVLQFASRLSAGATTPAGNVEPPAEKMPPDQLKHRVVVDGAGERGSMRTGSPGHGAPQKQASMQSETYEPMEPTVSDNLYEDVNANASARPSGSGSSGQRGADCHEDALAKELKGNPEPTPKPRPLTLALPATPPPIIPRAVAQPPPGPLKEDVDARISHEGCGQALQAADAVGGIELEYQVSDAPQHTRTESRTRAASSGDDDYEMPTILLSHGKRAPPTDDGDADGASLHYEVPIADHEGGGKTTHDHTADDGASLHYEVPIADHEGGGKTTYDHTVDDDEMTYEMPDVVPGTAAEAKGDIYDDDEYEALDTRAARQSSGRSVDGEYVEPNKAADNVDHTDTAAPPVAPRPRRLSDV